MAHVPATTLRGGSQTGTGGTGTDGGNGAGTDTGGTDGGTGTGDGDGGGDGTSGGTGSVPTALEAADAALSAAEGGSAAARGAAERARAEAVLYRDAQDLVLDRAEGSMGWSGRSPVARPVPAFAPPFDAESVDRRLRKTSGGADAATLLKATDIPPLPYEDGKIVMAAGASSSGDRLRMRGMPIIYYGSNAFRYYPSTNVDQTYIVENLASVQNNRSALVAGLTIAPDRLVVDMGGKGAEGWDFRVSSFGFSGADGLGSSSGRGYDLTLDFGRPSASPEGNAEHFWAAALMPTEAQIAAAGGDGGWLKDGERTLPLGVYHVRLSNHLGLDRRTEDPDGPAYPDDDANFYLAYAAYGFMDFFRPGIPITSFSAEHGHHRAFPFHVGYEAFKDEAETRTTDIAASDRISSGTFKGRTMAVRFQAQPIGQLHLTPGSGTWRMRGDIELTATISGTQADNTITGKISNMEDWDPDGYWKRSATIQSDLRFNQGTIDAKGEFTGTIPALGSFVRGGYRGNFYGPVDDLEAAGTWLIHERGGSGNKTAIAGSFGAALVRPDGSYGAEVRTGD